MGRVPLRPTEMVWTRTIVFPRLHLFWSRLVCLDILQCLQCLHTLQTFCTVYTVCTLTWFVWFALFALAINLSHPGSGIAVHVGALDWLPSNPEITPYIGAEKVTSKVCREIGKCDPWLHVQVSGFPGTIESRLYSVSMRIRQPVR